MALISSEEIKVGMFLEKDVKNSHGQLLIRAGAEITPRHLTLIRSWGIVELAIRGDAPRNLNLLDLQDIKPEQFAKAEALLRPKFNRAGLTDPIMIELFRYCAARKAKALHA